MVNWDLRGYSKEEFIAAWSESNSVNAVIRALGMTVSGGSYRSADQAAKELGLSKDHFTSQTNRSYSWEEILVENSPYVSTTNLKKRLITEKMLDPKCSAPFCPMPAQVLHPFTGEPIDLKLSLDHINGDNRDNRLENLRLLCQFCHSETDTWCGKGKVRRTSAGELPKPKFKLGECGHQVLLKSTNCSPCATKARNSARLKITYPPIDEMVAELKMTSFSAYAKVLGISDNGIRKHLVKNGIDPKSLS